jgi:tryptophan synthase alpha chain
MSRIATTFERLQAGNRKALVGYLMAGYPSVEKTLEAVHSLVRGGCDIIELGIPFSDPLADGATIQRAGHHALENGVTPRDCLDMAARLRKSLDTSFPERNVPIVFMTYYNPILNYGVDSFCAACREIGVDGFIVPDLPPDEGGELNEAAGRHSLDVIYLVAPTSTDERIRLVAENSSGFIYLVSLTGVTGARAALPVEIEDFVARVRSAAQQPLCIGFGISTPEQAERMARIADGVIVGSKLIDLVDSGDKNALEEFVRSLSVRMGGNTSAITQS